MREDLIKAAKDFLMVYFSDGERHTPSDFDEDIIGGTDVHLLFSGRTRWNSTPFFLALAELVEQKIVSFEHTDNGYEYFLTTQLVENKQPK